MKIKNLVTKSTNWISSSSKKAVKYFEKARQEFLNDNAKSLMYVEKSLSYDENYLDAILLKAELYQTTLKDSLALTSYNRIFEIDSMAYPKSAISMAKLYMKHFRYDESIALLKWFLSLQDQKEIIRNIAEKELSLAEFRKNLFENPVSYNPKNLGCVINSSDEDFAKLNSAIYNSEGAAKQMAATMQDNLKGDIEELGGAVDTMNNAMKAQL